MKEEMRKEVMNFLLLPLLALTGLFVSCNEEEIGPRSEGIQCPKTLKIIDLGLSIKWSNVNIGAERPEEYGFYFAWGETGTKDYFGWGSYSHCIGMDYTRMTKYTEKGKELAQGDDVAYSVWIDSVSSKPNIVYWRIPTAGQMNELLTRCTWTWTEVDGVKGYQVKGPNGNTLFLPAAGQKYSSSDAHIGERGCYWTRNQSTTRTDCAQCMIFEETSKRLEEYHRAAGCCIRPVVDHVVERKE